MQKMTKGKIFPQLLKFALPLVIGSLFQLTYNLFDFVVLGWFSSKPIESQAALGVASPIYNIFISLISGLCVGFAIHSSELYGKEDIQSLKKQFTSFLIVFGLFSIALTFLFNIFINPLMTLSNVKDDSLRIDAMIYLGIASLGFICSFFYNIYACFLRAMSDSLASLLFLILSCILNIVLNIILVVNYNLEIVGVAVSTVVSQFLSAIAIVIYGKLRYKNILVFNIKEYVIDFKLLKKSASYAIASALQQIVLFVGKFIVSIQINGFDAYYIAAYAGATKIDEFVFTPTQNFGHAASIFMAQNKGDGNNKRYKQGFKTGFLLNIVYGIIISFVVFFLKEELVDLFINKNTPDRSLVIEKGILYLSYMSFLYIIPAITNSVQSFFRGLGKLRLVFLSTTANIIGRVITIVVLIKLIAPMEASAFANLGGWITMLLFEVPFLVYHYKHLDKYIKIV